MDADADPYRTIIKIISLIILIFLSGLFSSAETAYISCDKFYLRKLVQSGNKKAKKVEKILENKDSMLSAILIGNNCVNLSASALTTTLVYDLYGNQYVSIATGILTFIILIFGEILPKTIANRFAEKIAMWYSSFLYVFIKILTPIIFIVNFISSLVMKLFKIETKATDPIVTEEVVKTMLDMSLEDDQIEKEEHEIIRNVLELNDSCAEDIMIPRSNVVGVNESSSYDEIVNIFKTERYSRLVVMNDKQNAVLGILNIKDVFFADKDNFDIKSIIRQPYFTYETKNNADLLNEMRKSSNNMAVVLDEYGDLMGILTMEDILEEFVGQIRDEFDEEELKQIKKIENNVYEVEGSLNLDDINEALDLNLESEEYNSIGGYIIEKLEDFPKEGDNVRYESIYLEVLSVINNKIGKVKIVLS